LLEVETGNVLASQKIEGNPDDDIFSIVDRLTIQTKNNLSLPSEALLEPDPEIADNTTHSSVAYRFYLSGVENYNKMYYADARSDFKSALEYDSTFAMAYYYLAFITDLDLIHKAVHYADEAGTIDQLYIKCKYAYRTGDKILYEELLNDIIRQYPDEKTAHYFLGNLKTEKKDYAQAIIHLNDAIDIYPQFKLAYNQLAYVYNLNEEFDKALWAIDKYIELAPNEANPLDTKAEIYALNGMIDNAIESYIRALNVKPDFYASLKNLGLMYMFKQEYDKADSCLNLVIAAEDTTYREVARKYKCYIPLFQGKLEQALQVIDIAGESCIDHNSYSLLFMKSLIYIKKDNWASALEEIENTIVRQNSFFPEDSISYRYFRIYILANGGNIKRATQLTEELKATVEQTGECEYAYWFAEGALALVQADYEKSIDYFKTAKELNNVFFTTYMMAKVYRLANMPEMVIDELESLKDVFGVDRAYFAIWSTELYYNLGLAYEQTGQINKAIEQYNIFLDIWKNADADIEEINDARDRLARLQSQS